MTIRKKIFLLAGILLVLFGLVVAALATIHKLNSDEIGNIVAYELPLSRLIAEFDVDTDRYELRIRRMLQADSMKPAELQAAISDVRKVGGELRNDVAEATKLLNQAIKDTRYRSTDRVELAGIAGAFKFISRDLEDFLAVGEVTIAAVVDGRRDDARAASLGFVKFAQAFGADLSEIRNNVADLTEGSTQAILVRERLNTYLSAALFLAACGIGLSISAVGSTQVVGGLRKLVAATRAVGTGADLVPVLIRTRDEVGELAQSFNRMIEEVRTRERIKETFGKFVDPRIVATMVSDTGEVIELANRQVVTVFFSDIAGFTSISEQLTPTAIVNLLNHYFAAVTAPIVASHGIVDKYIGDGLLAFWAAPFSPGDTHATAACLAVLKQQDALQQLNRELPEVLGLRRSAPTLHVRVGLATGDAIVGTIGSATSKSFTVIGDTVNLASRLEGANKIYGTKIIITEETQRIAQDQVECRELDLMTVVGKSEPVRIYELLAAAGALAPGDAELREEFGKGLAAYRAREWDAAEREFRSCLELRPEDAPSTIYIERIATFRKEPPPANWDGVWHLTKK
jgi:adenylate cyclase